MRSGGTWGSLPSDRFTARPLFPLIFKIFHDSNERHVNGHNERSDDNAYEAERLDPAEHGKKGEEKTTPLR